jgi:hypothetical protein
MKHRINNTTTKNRSTIWNHTIFPLRTALIVVGGFMTGASFVPLLKPELFFCEINMVVELFMLLTDLRNLSIGFLLVIFVSYHSHKNNSLLLSSSSSSLYRVIILLSFFVLSAWWHLRPCVNRQWMYQSLSICCKVYLTFGLSTMTGWT